MRANGVTLSSALTSSVKSSSNVSRRIVGAIKIANVNNNSKNSCVDSNRRIATGIVGTRITVRASGSGSWSNNDVVNATAMSGSDVRITRRSASVFLSNSAG